MTYKVGDLVTFRYGTSLDSKFLERAAGKVFEVTGVWENTVVLDIENKVDWFGIKRVHIRATHVRPVDINAYICELEIF